MKPSVPAEQPTVSPTSSHFPGRAAVAFMAAGAVGGSAATYAVMDGDPAAQPAALVQRVDIPSGDVFPKTIPAPLPGQPDRHVKITLPSSTAQEKTETALVTVQSESGSPTDEAAAKEDSIVQPQTHVSGNLLNIINDKLSGDEPDDSGNDGNSADEDGHDDDQTDEGNPGNEPGPADQPPETTPPVDPENDPDNDPENGPIAQLQEEYRNNFYKTDFTRNLMNGFVQVSGGKDTYWLDNPAYLYDASTETLWLACYSSQAEDELTMISFQGPAALQNIAVFGHAGPDGAATVPDISTTSTGAILPSTEESDGFTDENGLEFGKILRTPPAVPVGPAAALSIQNNTLQLHVSTSK